MLDDDELMYTRILNHNATPDEITNYIDNLIEEIEEKTTILMAGAEKVKALEKEVEKLKSKNKDLLRKLKNRVKDVKKLEKYSTYKKEFKTLNEQIKLKDEEIKELKENIEQLQFENSIITEIKSTESEKEEAKIIKNKLDIKDEDEIIRSSKPNFENDLLKEVEKIIKKYYK